MEDISACPIKLTRSLRLDVSGGHEGWYYYFFVWDPTDSHKPEMYQRDKDGVHELDIDDYNLLRTDDGCSRVFEKGVELDDDEKEELASGEVTPLREWLESLE